MGRHNPVIQEPKTCNITPFSIIKEGKFLENTNNYYYQRSLIQCSSISKKRLAFQQTFTNSIAGISWSLLEYRDGV